LGANKLTYETIQHNLEKLISDSYVLAFQLQSQKEYLIKEILELRKRIVLVELLTKKGILQESDYLLVQLDLKSKTTELQQVQSNLNSSINQLYTICNVESIDQVILLEPNISKNNKFDTLFLDRKYKNDSTQIEASTLVFNNQYKPKLALYANTGVNSTDITRINHHVGVSGGVRLIIPIYDGGQKNVFAQQQAIYQENLNAYKESNKLQLTNNLKNIQTQIDNTQNNLTAIVEQSAIQSNVLDVYKTKLANGQVSIVDFLNVSRDYRLTQLLKIQIETNLWLLYNQFNFTNW
jgi:outer membrane protein TolC